MEDPGISSLSPKLNLSTQSRAEPLGSADSLPTFVVKGPRASLINGQLQVTVPMRGQRMPRAGKRALFTPVPPRGASLSRKLERREEAPSPILPRLSRNVVTQRVLSLLYRDWPDNFTYIFLML